MNQSKTCWCRLYLLIDPRNTEVLQAMRKIERSLFGSNYTRKDIRREVHRSNAYLEARGVRNPPSAQQCFSAMVLGLSTKHVILLHKELKMIKEMIECMNKS